MASTVAGIVHNAGIPGGPRIHLPLEQMAAHVLILDGMYDLCALSM